MSTDETICVIQDEFMDYIEGLQPTMNETKAFAQKCFKGYKPTPAELKKHSANLRSIVADKHGINPKKVDEYLKNKYVARQRRNGVKRKELCPCGSGIQYRKCCGRFSR